MKKGLSIIYDPHNLYQFVWYYCNADNSKKEWDALCLPNGYKGEYMHPFCEKAGIFSKVYANDKDYQTISVAKKMEIVFGMFFHFIFGQRRNYCKKLLKEYVSIDDYDEIVIIADVGIVSGACVSLGQEKKVVILEDGINDYSCRSKWIPKNKIKSLYAWQGFIMARMGYCAPGWYYLNDDSFCIKYASQPEKMIYKNYKEILPLYSKEGTDQQLFDTIIKRIYPAISNIDFNECDAIIFTRPLDDFVKNGEKYKKKIEEYIDLHYKNVLIKKHPREKNSYNFNSNVKSIEADNSIPAEALLPYLTGKDILIVTTSAISLFMKAHHLKCKILFFDQLYEESITENTKFKPLPLEDTKQYCEKFASNCYEIVVL